MVACLWENDAVRHRAQLVIPDGCVDLVWFGDTGLKVVGADTGPRTVAPLGSAVTGIRLAGIEFDAKTLRVIAEVDGTARALVTKLPAP